MSESSLLRLLGRSSFRRFLDIDPKGGQLPSFIATVKGLKPAMDVWVRAVDWEAFERLMSYFGLHYHADSYFDKHAEAMLKSLPRESFTTTRAVLSREFAERTEAHVFLARTREAVTAVASAGWYPLVVDGCVVDKHLADHEEFGEALGYPGCCRAFFRRRNNWFSDNTYYAAYINTADIPNALSNGLLRHTAYCYTPHMACSFSCSKSMSYGGKLREIIVEESQDYAIEADRQVCSPVLCLSELQIYRFDGGRHSSDIIRYESVEPVNPTSQRDRLYKMLAQGDTCVIDRNIVRVQRRGIQTDAYAARADKHGPEFPFIIQCA